MNLNAFDFDPELIAKELDREEEMRASGAAAFKERSAKERERGAVSGTYGGRHLAAGMIQPLADLIIEEISRLEGGAVKRKPPELKHLKLLPPKDTAFIAIRALLNFCARYGTASSFDAKNTIAPLCKNIGKNIESEYRVRCFRRDHRPYYDAKVRSVRERTSSPEQLKKELLTAIKNMENSVPFVMGPKEHERLGQLLVVAMERLEILTTKTVWRRGRKVKLVDVTATTLEMMVTAEDGTALLRPYFFPSIVPPRPWESLHEGGYYTNIVDRRGLIISRRSTNGAKEASAEQMPLVFEQLNYLQNTPWSINSRVLRVVEQMQKNNISCSSLPPAELEPLPAKPHDIAENEEARAAYKKKAAEVHNRRASVKGRVLASLKTVTAARDCEELEKFYFPKVVDFRGRVYDVANHLNPQGDDLAKGLLMFANAKRLGETGIYWLAVHGANVYGEDKCPFDDRVAWVEANTTQIAAAAEDPFAERFWMDADKPFQFLAFCFEWAGALDKGEDHMSYIPVAMDGSCNGLQHLSALLRDSVGGSAVNLVPSDRPQDIYTEVLNKVVSILKEKAQSGEPTAQKWLPLMKRKVVKRPVMTLPYGATRNGFAGQIMDDTINPLKKAGACPFDDDFEAARYLGEIVWKASGEVVVAARAAMDWLQAVAKVVASEGKAIEWTTASGFRVVQDYRKVLSRQVKLMAFGEQIKLMVAEGFEDKIDKQKMSMAIAPNFVHALDAAHLLRAVRDLTQRRGFSIHLSMVHDSYATHACDVEDMRVSIRASFTEMYQERCWLGDFKKQIEDQIGPEAAEKLPPVPKRGSLEIDEVVNSQYFFA